MPVKIPSDFCERFKTAFNAGDVDGLVDLYADEIVAVPNPGNRLSGKDELRGALGFFLGLPNPRLDFTTEAIVEGPDTALFYGAWVFDADAEEDEDPTHIDARAIVVLERRDDGWYAVLDDFFAQG